MRAWRIAWAAVAVASVVAGAVVPVTPASADSIVAVPTPSGAADEPVPIQRVGGADRYETAAALSAATFPARVPRAYVVSGEQPIDALALAPLAGRQGAPVLLTRPDALPSVVATELARLAPASVVVVGGTDAVSDAVVSQVSATTPGAVVARVGGADRFETAALLASGVQRGVPVVYLASAGAPVDALAAGPTAASSAAPLLLLTHDTVPAATAATLARLRPATVRVVGGDDVVAPSTMDAAAVAAGLPLIQLPFGPVRQGAERVAGPDRYATSARLFSSFGPSPALFLASGQSIVDGLAAGPAASRRGGSLLLTRPDCIPAAVDSVLRGAQPAAVIAVGGESAVGQVVLDRQPCAPASGGVHVTVTPAENLGDGDGVTVNATGFPAGAQVAAVECNTDPGLPRNGAGCFLGSVAFGVAGPDGDVGPLKVTIRTGQLNADPRAVCPPTPDQLARGITCGIGMGTPDASVVGSAPISFRPLPPPPTMTVTPASGLVDGQTVTVTGAGYDTGDLVRIVECSGRSPASFFPPIFTAYGCEDPRGTIVTVGPDGTLPATELVVRAGPLSGGSGASCPPTPAQVAAGVTSCTIIVEKDGRAIAQQAIDVAPIAGTPHVTASPVTGLHPGDRVTVTADGFAPYTPLIVSLCNPAFLAPLYGLGPYGPCLTSIGVTSDADGRAGPVDIVVVQQGFDGGLTCPPTPEQVAQGMAACVVIVAAPSGATVGVPIAFAPDVVAPLLPPDLYGEVVLIDAVTPASGTVVLRNPTAGTIDVGGWWLADLAGNVVVIPTGTTIAPGATLTVQVGSILDPAFDAVTLYDANGQPRASKTWSAPPT